MSNLIKKSAIAIVLGGAAAMAGLTFAQADTVSSTAATLVAQATTPSTGGATARSQWLNLGQIYERVVAAGYTDVREIEREKDGYEVKAKDAQGRSVKLYMEPVEGKIVKEKVRDDD